MNSETPPRFAQLSDDELHQLNAVCEAFETTFGSETPHRIEQYLAAASDQIHNHVLGELLAIELELRLRRNERPRSAEYEARFPDSLQTVRSVFHRVIEAPSTEHATSQPDTILFDSPAVASDDSKGRLPDSIGRYRIDCIRGEGGFGIVYKGYDSDLDRPVAIKVPRPELIAAPEDAERYRTEARTVARLDHSGIVPVYDIGSTPQYPCFFVSRFIDGISLAELLKQKQPDFIRASELAAATAEALHFAHLAGVVHRDVKPGNILIDAHGAAFLADFGLALRDEDVGLGPRYAGTPAYMSPEVAHGEGHRVDGRSDVFSLGIILYEMLTGRRPFRGTTKPELMDQVANYVPQPPRECIEQIPPELERICLKALSKQAAKRYATAQEMAADLRLFLSAASAEDSGHGAIQNITPGSDLPSSTDLNSWSQRATSYGLGSVSQNAQVVPRGLRSFDAHDADFFLRLLPGPRDRSGLPDCIQFWKTRIEECREEHTFPVGLIYGPSGCGKSSLVKAGLLPRLASHVAAICIESADQGTESRLLQALSRHHPTLPTQNGLKETFAALRRGQGIRTGHKVLIVLDQFEQWLHGRHEHRSTELLQALRQCDGEHIQCILMVRDDFWLAGSRFMQDLEVDLIPHHNIALADLFDIDHARRVLAAFGQGFGKLPANTSDMSRQQKDFLTQAVQSLATEGKVVCVQLALFAEMMKHKDWTSAALKAVGGATGLGVTFLEETFESRTANPAHRRHQAAVRRVLELLLPEPGTDIKGQMRPYDELLAVTGYASPSPEFDDLIRILDGDLRIISPTEEAVVSGVWREAGNDRQSPGTKPPEEDGAMCGSLPSPFTTEHLPPATLPATRSYQLAHDYLVPPLREWLTRQRKETREGRAELILAERASLWSTRPEKRHLPSLIEWVRIATLTDRKRWTELQRQLMQYANRLHSTRLALTAGALAILFFTGIALKKFANDHKNEAESSRLVEGLLRADTSQVASIITNLDAYRRWANEDLKAAFDSSTDQSNAKLHAGLALAAYDHSVIPFLSQRLLHLSADQFPHARDLLVDHKEELISVAKDAATDATADADQRFLAACVLASFQPEHAYWDDEAACRFVAHHLVNVEPSELLPWRDALRPVKQHLIDGLSDIYRDESQRDGARSFATITLADYASEDADFLADLLIDSDERAFATLFPVLKAHGPGATRQLHEVLDRTIKPDWRDKEINPAWWPLADSVTDAIRAADGAVHERFAFALSVPFAEFQDLANQMTSSGYRPVRVRPYRRETITTEGDPKQIDPQTLIAAAWKRDGKRWELQSGITIEELPEADTVAEQGGLVPAHISAIPRTDLSADQEEQQFVLLWNEPNNDSEQRKLQYNRSGTEIIADQSTMSRAGFEAQISVAVWTEEQTDLRFAGIWSNQGAVSDCHPAYEGFELFHRPQWDVASDPINVEFASADQFAAIWHADIEFESRLLSQIPVSAMAHESQVLANQDFRLVALTVSNNKCSSVWHRPVISAESADKLAGQQATAAAALLRTGQAETVIPLLRQQPEPYLRNHLVHQFVSCRADPVFLLEQLEKEQEVSIQRALILAIGEFIDADRFTGDRQRTTELLVRLFKNDQDAGIHAAAEWTLRQIGASDEIKRVRDSLATGQPEGNRNWYTTRHGSHDMVLIESCGRFLMGSPVDENDRFQGPSGDNERRHLREINRHFAIGSHEVTVEQFQLFRPNHTFARQIAREPDAPADLVSWFEAAEFCNWLSEQEGIPSDQWCYDPDQKIASGMQMLPDYLQRTGYRLPTEAEWEFACRGGSVTARPYGVSEELLGEYCWYSENSREKWMLPVGQLKPNDYGLFDMLGNAMEWSQDRATLFKKDRDHLTDAEVPGSITNQQGHVFRGGSFGSKSAHVRSSCRLAVGPDGRMHNGGFRIARSLPNEQTDH